MSEGGVWAAMLAFLGIFLLFMVVYYIILAIAGWKINTKAGEAGWKALIPIYNNYILYKIAWKGMFFFVWFALTAVASWMSSAGAGSDSAAVYNAIGGLAGLLAFGVSFISNLKLSKAFGHGTGFALGLAFLSPIFLMILGFGSSEYVGNQS